MALPLLDEGEDVTAMFSIPSAEDGDDVTAMFSVPSVNEGKDVNKMFSVPSAEDGEDVTSQFNASAAPTSNVIANMGRSFLGGVAGGVADIVGGAAGFVRQNLERNAPADIAYFQSKVDKLQKKRSVFDDFKEEQIRTMQAAPEGYRTASEEFDLKTYQEFVEKDKARLAKVEGAVAPVRDFQKLSSEASKEAQTFFGQDPARQDEFLSKLAAGAGSLPPYIASSIAGGPVLSMMTGALQTGQNEYNAAIEAGRPDLADEAMVKGMVIGLTEGAGVGGGLEKAAQGFAAKALVTLKKGFEEGGQEWVQNTLSNLNASTFTGYDPARPALKGSGEAFAIGAILGGGVEGVTQPFRSDKTTTPSVAPETAAAVARTQPVTVTVPEVAPIQQKREPTSAEKAFDEMAGISGTLPSGTLGPPDPIVVEAEAVGATQTAAALNQTILPTETQPAALPTPPPLAVAPVVKPAPVAATASEVAAPAPVAPAAQAPVVQEPAPVARAMTRSEINERIAVLLKAPVKAGGKPRVSFKTQAEETSFRRGFEAANKKPGEPPPEQRPGVPAKEQKIYDAFSQGWSQAQTTIRSLNQPTPAPSPAPAPAAQAAAPVVLTETTSSGKFASKRKVTQEGLDRVEAARQALRDIINNPDITGPARSDAIENGRNLIAFLDGNADTRRPLDEGYNGGDRVAYTGEDSPDGFRAFIRLDGYRAGSTGVERTPEAKAADGEAAKKVSREQQAAFKEIRESGKSDQMPPSRKPTPAPSPAPAPAAQAAASEVAAPAPVAPAAQGPSQVSEAEKTLAETKSKAKPDKIESAFDKAIDALKPSKGTLYADPLFIQTVGRPALRAALQVARAAYRAGKTVAQAVAEGIAHLKTLVKNLDEAKAQEFFAEAGLDDGLPMPGELVEGGREGEYYTRVAERDKGTLSDNAMKVVRNRTTLPDTFKKDLDEAAKILLETNEGDLRSALNRSKEMSASGIKDYFSGLTDRRKAALLFLIAQNAATQRETATDPKQIAALKDIEAEAIADFTDMMSQGGKLLNIAGQLYAAMPMSPDAQVMAAEKLLARMTGGRAAEVEAEQAKDTLKTALDEQLKGMDESIREIMQTKPKASWDEIRQRIADEVVAKMNLATDAERKAATDKIIADLKKRMEKVRKELLAKMSKPGKPGNKIALEKLWKLWELGALDDDAFTKVFMEKAGVQEFTPAFRDKLKKMYEDAEAAPEGMPRDRVLGNVAVEIALANPKTFSFWWNLAMSISYGNILGAFTTIFVNNPLGSLATSLEMVAMGSLSNKGARAETFKGAVKTWARSFGDGVAMMRDLWSTGENLQKISQFDSALVNSPVELLAKMAEDPSYPKSFRVAAKAVSQYKWVMRSMMAADAVIRWPAREALRFTQSAAIAKDTRRPGQSLEDAVDELNYPGGRLAALKESRAQAAQELKDGTLKTKQDKRLRVIQLLQSKLSLEGTETASESDELANYGSLLNDQPQDFIGVIASAILKTAFPSNTKSDLQKALGGALQPFVRFVRTSANATRVMLDYAVGYGAFRYMTRNWPVIGAESLAGGVNLIQPGGRDKMSNDAAIRAGDKLTQVRIQRAYLGMALYAGLAAIYAAIDDDDEDPYIDFIGSGPTTPDERRRVRESGVRFNSIKIGDIYVPTSVGPLQPLAGILGPFQRMRDNKKYPKAKDEFDELVPETAGVAIAKGIYDAISNQSFTRSLADLLTMANTGKTSFGETPDEFLGKTLAQFVPGNLRGLSQLDEIVRGKKERADGFFDTATNSIAFYAPNGRATTILGDEVDAGKSIAQKAGEKVFQFTTLADDKTLQFVVKNGLSIPDRKRKPSDGKRQTYLEYSTYVRESGKMMRNWLETKNPKTGKTGMEMLQAIPDKITVEKGKTVNLRKKEMNKLWVDFREVALAKQ